MTVYRNPYGTWSYLFKYKGKRYKKHFKSQQRAIREETKKKSQLHKGYLMNEDLIFDEAGKEFFEKHSVGPNPKRPNKKSWADDKQKIELLSQLFGAKKLCDFTPEDIQDMRNHLVGKGLKSTTIDRYHALVKTIFNKMKFWRKFSGYNPADGVKLKREPNARVRFFNMSEIEILVRDLPRSLYPYFMAALHTGMRRSEICNLCWKYVNLSWGDIYIEKAKSGKARHIPINGALHKLLKELYGKGKDDREPVFGNLNKHYISHKFAKVCKKAGIKDVRFHDLRHTFASQLVMEGVDLYQVCKWLGHSSVLVTEKYYAHLSPFRKRDQLERLNKLTDSIPATGGYTEKYTESETPGNSQESGNTKTTNIPSFSHK